MTRPSKYLDELGETIKFAMFGILIMIIIFLLAVTIAISI